MYVYTSTHTHIKLCVHWVKNYGINGKEVPTEDWEELMYAYKATSRSTSAPKYKLINCLHLSGCLHLSKYLGAIPMSTTSVADVIMLFFLSVCLFADVNFNMST